jgi:SAM-dependent methyltransferase
MNPWLDIPLADYEGHMSLPDIGQAAMLAGEFGALLARYRPSSVAVIGCAGGNGFDRVPSFVERLVGVDINPGYIDLAASRYAGRISGLELYVGDIQSERQLFQPVDLIYAALVFEYVDVARTMRALSRCCVHDGVLATVVQLPHETKSSVTPSPFSSLQRLSPVMQLIEPDALATRASDAGFTLEDSTVITSPGDKQFAVQIFRHAAET